MKDSWFDSETGVLRLDEMVLKSDSFQNIMRDGVVTDEERIAQGQLVSGLLNELDKTLPLELHARVGKVLVELAVLQAIQIHQSR